MAVYNSFDLFIIRNQYHLTRADWDVISEKYELSEDMMRLFQTKLNWRNIAQHQELSIDFIKEFINYNLKEYINVICKYQKLNEDFIDEYKNILDWGLILEYQDVSTSFILNHAEDIKNFKDNSWDEVDH